MAQNPFQSRTPFIAGNPKLRSPQVSAFEKIQEECIESSEREFSVVLPVGCGKSGCITLVPFAFKSKKTLVVAPGVKIAQQLAKDFDPTKSSMFYLKCAVLDSPPFPEPAEIRGTTSNKADLDEADVVITNIQQLQGSDNKWLNQLPKDYFDLILVDEAHHNVAESWNILREHFPDAKIVNFSATPMRADGQIMNGRIVYSYPIFQAIQEGYIKRLKAVVLNPTTLKYVRVETGKEIEVSLAEVVKLGEEDAKFRRSIVTSKETLTTIVDASIRELERIKSETGDSKHKIIASALNYQHCIQIVEAYRGRGLRADYVHSREGSDYNVKVMKKLEEHELDVIVQVRKLGEGFDHPYLSVAAVFSIFTELSPFIQFVGRIMRVIKQNDPLNLLNQGSVVFHAGANVAQRWADFQHFSQADQEYFDQLLPIEGWDFTHSSEMEVVPKSRTGQEDNIHVNMQGKVILSEIPLIEDDPEVQSAIAVLLEKGISVDDYARLAELKPVPTTRLKERQAKRATLNEKVKNEVGKILRERGLNPMGKDIAKNHLGRTNFVVLKSAIDNRINKFVHYDTNSRNEFSREQLDSIEANFGKIIEEATEEVLNAQA